MKKVYRILAIMLLFCSLLFYIPNLQTSYAKTITHNGVTYDSVTTETDIWNDTCYMYYSSYDEESQKYLYDKSSSFNKYIGKTDEIKYSYFLDILEIAETENNELIVYTYEPIYILNSNDVLFVFDRNYHAKSINISVGSGQDLSFINYKLEPLSIFYRSNITSNLPYWICKYKVKNFIVSDNATRYYEFSTIYSDITPDGQSVGLQENGQTIDEYAFPVACKYRFVTGENGNVTVDKQSSIVITVKDMFVGYVRYKNTATPSWIDKDSCDRHFVAFTTDKRMDKLLEADVYFSRQNCRIVTELWPRTTYGDIIEDYSYLDYTNKAEIQNSGNLFWGGYTYSWNRIQNINSFISSIDMTTVYTKAIFDVSNETKINSEAIEELESKEWVLSFYESDYEYSEVVGGMAPLIIEERTAVGEVSILRLCFETDGVRYNLGAISNKQTGSDEPINTNNISISIGGRAKGIWDLIKIILGILAVIIILSLLAPFLPVIFKFLLLVLKGILSILALPFRLIKGKRKGKR